MAAIFLLNLPLALGSIALAEAFVHDAVGEKHAALDLSGAFLATASLGALTWGLTRGTGPQGWSADAVATLATGSFLLVAFLWVEHRKGDQAMMPLTLFGSRSFVGITLLTLTLYGALAGLLVLVPYVLIQEAGYSGLAAGAALLPFPLVIATMSPLIGALSGRIGARIPLIVGPLVVAAGFLLAARIGSGSSYWTTFLPAIVLIALGMAGAVAPLTTAVLTAVDASHAGSASGFNSAVARTGGLVATALLGSVLAASGAELIADFRIAVAVCSIASLAAALSAYALIAN